MTQTARPTIEAVAAAQAAKVKIAFNRCIPESESLAEALREAGHEATVMRCSHLLTRAPKADARWLKLNSQIYWTHYVVRVGDRAIDLTRRQFFPDAPQPFIQDWDDLLAEWDDVTERRNWAKELYL